MNSSDAMYGASPKRFQMPLCDRLIATEVSNDYVLPDYQPEIRRVLRVSAAPLPPAKYIGGGKAEFNGTLDYQLLYIGSDGELYSAPLSAEYAFSAPLELSSEFDLNEGVLLLADIRDEGITARVGAPRKLNIKCRLSARVKAYGMMICEERISGEVNPLSIERLDGEFPSLMMLSGMGETAELSDEIALGADDTRVVSAYADAVVTDVSAADGYADCRGELRLSLLTCRDGSPASAEVISRSVPFNEQIEIEDITPEATCRGSAYVSDMTVSVEEGKILCSMNIIPEVVAHKVAPISYTRDIYSTENYCENAYRDYLVPTLTALPRGNFSQSERIPLSETNIPAGSRVIDVLCKPVAERLERDKGRSILCGQSKYSILLENGGEYSVSEITLPFRYELSADLGEQSELGADIRALLCRARVDGENLGIDTELSVCAEIYGTQSVRTASEVRFGERVEKAGGDMIICFPAEGDTVWSVSKKYFVPTSKISAPVGVDEDLGTVNYIIINS
ncbi:MAG: DUF3794 domain-containing protein [Clostridia bacterium]|nr:DUF3794 domain-containing protein [Clostridia bacterium]